MKKVNKFLFFAFAVMAGLAISCSSEESAIAASNNAKTVEMENFRLAFKDWARQKKEAGKLSQEVNDAFVLEAKELILSTGVSNADLTNRTKGNDAAIISMALKIYAQKTHKKSNSNTASL